MKTHVLMLSRTFPVTHPKAGQNTHFKFKILRCRKKHTIRTNYEYWKKRIDEVNEGVAVISVREWIEDPYRSKQRELFKFEKCQVGYQMIQFGDSDMFYPPTVDGKAVYVQDLIDNDGLSYNDFCDWFKGYDTTKPMIIIHFSNFRY